MENKTHRANFKKGVTSEDGRRRREEKAVALRKDKKEEGLSKRRNMSTVETSDEVVANAATPTDALIRIGESPKVVSTVSDIPALMQGLLSNDNEAKLSCLRQFRKLLSTEQNPPVQKCIDCGALPIFVQSLERHDFPQLQFEAAWALTNIASTDKTRVVVDSGALPLLTQLLQSPNADIREQCAWCLGNIAGDGSEHRNIVLSLNALEPLAYNVAQPANLSLLRNCTWALSNFCRGKPQPPMHVVAPALPVLAHVLMNSNDQDTIIDATWALSYLSDGENARIQAVVDLNIVPTLIGMLQSQKSQYITPALRTLGNIVSGNDAQTQAVLNANAVVALLPLLGHSKKNIRKEACWMVSNIAAGTPSQLNQLLSNPELIPRVLTQMQASSEWDVRKEASWVISNIITGGTLSHVMLLVEYGAIRPICDLLDVSEVRMITVAIDALDAMLKTSGDNQERLLRLIDEAGGVDKLEVLQEHENEDVYKKAVSMLEKYFGGQEDQPEFENIVPTVSENQATFAFGMNSAAPFQGFGGAAPAFSFGQPAAAGKAQPEQASVFGFGQQQQQQQQFGFPSL